MGFHRRTSPPLTAHLDRRIGLVCFSRSFGGLEMTTLRLAGLLSGRGAGVHLIVPQDSPMHLACRRHSFAFSTLEPAMKYGDLLTAWRLRGIFAAEKLDSVVFFRSQDIHLGSLASLAGSATRLVFYQQMQSGIGKKDLFHSFVFSRLSAWLTLTEIMRAEVLHHTSMLPARVHVAPLGRDQEAFRPSPPLRAVSRRALKIPPGTLAVGLLGRLDRQKGQMELIESISTVKAKLPRSLFLLAGDETKNDTGMRERLERRIAELNLSRVVRILPPTDDVPSFLSALDIFTMPSYSETYGLVLIEAMAMGLPVIATNSGGVPELVRDGVEGMLVEPKDIRQLSDALLALGTSQTLRRRLGTNGRARFLSAFRDDICTDTLVRILSALPR